MNNQNYALGTRGTLNMLNKVVAKLARKPNNPNVGEKTRNALYNGQLKLRTSKMYQNLKIN